MRRKCSEFLKNRKEKNKRKEFERITHLKEHGYKEGRGCYVQHFEKCDMPVKEINAVNKETNPIIVENYWNCLDVEEQVNTELVTDADGYKQIKVKKGTYFKAHDSTSAVEEQKLSKTHRKLVNKLAKVNPEGMLRVNKRLLAFLRIKFAFKVRDAALIQSMAHEARIWMLNNGFSLDKHGDYVEMMSSITAAYLVTREELLFRACIKERHNYDNMLHHNRTMVGDLGRTSKLNPICEDKSLGTRLGLTKPLVLNPKPPSV